MGRYDSNVMGPVRLERPGKLWLEDMRPGLHVISVHLEVSDFSQHLTLTSGPMRRQDCSDKEALWVQCEGRHGTNYTSLADRGMVPYSHGVWNQWNYFVEDLHVDPANYEPYRSPLSNFGQNRGYTPTTEWQRVGVGSRHQMRLAVVGCVNHPRVEIREGQRSAGSFCVTANWEQVIPGLSICTTTDGQRVQVR